jgi:hypothetical protein
MTIKTHILQELEQLNEDQLQQVEQFIATLKISFKLPNQSLNQFEQIAKLYQEFAEEDRLLAETGLSEYLLNIE